MEIMLIVAVIVGSISFLLGIATEKLNQRGLGKKCSTFVVSKSTGHKYHANKYSFGKDGELHIRIYNHFNHKAEWYPVWHFEHAFSVAYSLDPDYTMKHWFKFVVGAHKDKDFSEANKK